jgi:hypothetical protein
MEKLCGRNHLEDGGVDGRNVKIDCKGKRCIGLEWIQLA